MRSVSIRRPSGLSRGEESIEHLGDVATLHRSTSRRAGRPRPRRGGSTLDGRAAVLDLDATIAADARRGRGRT